MIRWLSTSSASRPKVIAPRQSSLTCRPVLPTKRYSMMHILSAYSLWPLIDRTANRRGMDRDGIFDLPAIAPRHGDGNRNPGVAQHFEDGAVALLKPWHGE